MLRVVIDTNCLRASIPPKSPFYQLYIDFKAGKFEWYVSTEILLEYEKILSNTYSPNTAKTVLHQVAIAPNVIFAESVFQWYLVEDKDNNRCSDLALSINADYLITNDTDFNIFKNLDFPTLSVLNLETVLSILNQDK